jgi:hypothetical protein
MVLDTISPPLPSKCGSFDDRMTNFFFVHKNCEYTKPNAVVSKTGCRWKTGCLKSVVDGGLLYMLYSNWMLGIICDPLYHYVRTSSPN